MVGANDNKSCCSLEMWDGRCDDRCIAVRSFVAWASTQSESLPLALSVGSKGTAAVICGPNEGRLKVGT